MSDDKINETIEQPSAQDEADLAALYGSDEGPEIPNPTFHPILKIWLEVLKPAESEGNEPVTPQYAMRMIQGYPGLDFGDMLDLRDEYYARINVLLGILKLEVESDDECLTYTTPEEDREENSHHYKNLLMQWQLQFLQWELEWNTMDANAAIVLAAISEIHKMFFSQTGLTSYLENIQFQYTESDQAELAEALAELKDGQ